MPSNRINIDDIKGVLSNYLASNLLHLIICDLQKLPSFLDNVNKECLKIILEADYYYKEENTNNFNIEEFLHEHIDYLCNTYSFDNDYLLIEQKQTALYDYCQNYCSRLLHERGIIV